jgi:protein-S-isoprenylcysteine O-methyltransferase Ste14
MIQVVIFIAVSVFLAYVSRASLFDPRSHGFYRFFAWESILALVLLNARIWFRDPWAVHQVISWLLLTLSAVLVVDGAYVLHTLGKPGRGREDEQLIGIEKTTVLITTGIYRYIRHPIYAAGFYGVWGVFFKDPSWPGAALAVSATVFLVLTAKTEEVECIDYFGSAYREYMRESKRFIPFLF